MVQEILINDKKYPKFLKDSLVKLQTSSGPKNLYYKGNLDLIATQENCLAVVGSRHLTSYGRRATEQIVAEAAMAGITIVSGFMYGGDEAAHSAAVKCGGKTIAVMPCGINLVHPENQKELYQKILDNNGLIISEYEEKTQPQTFTYIQRDRIVAGLSKAVLVTEAALNSGSLITASYAKKMGKKVFALPGQITSEVSKGALKLIKEGAEVVTEAKDILDFFGLAPGQKSFSSAFAKTSAGKHSALEERIIEQLKREAMEADNLAHALSVPVAQLGTALSLMQLKGFINLDSGKYYVN